MTGNINGSALASPMQFGRRRLLGAAATAAGMAGLTAACGRKGRGKPSASGRPAYGGALNVGEKTDPPSFDPAAKLVATETVLLLTNNRLVTFKTGPDVRFDEIIVQPDLAERWEAPDGQTFIFHLRAGVKFADLPPVNGRAFTSSDVKWTFEYLTRTGQIKDLRLPPAPVAAMFAGLDHVDVPDPSTAVIHFGQPFAPFLSYATAGFASVLAHEIFDQDGSFAKRAVGTGPWQLDMSASQHGARWVYQRNQNYFMTGRPYLDQVNDIIIADDATFNAAFQAKQVDIVDYSGLSTDAVKSLLKSVPGAIKQEQLNPLASYMYLNATRPPLDDARVRQAFALAIDRDAFLRVTPDTKGEWALASGLTGLFTQEEVKQILRHDPDTARHLLSAAGHSNGVDVEALYPGAAYGQGYLADLQLLQSQLKAIGINLNLRSVDQPTYESRKRGSDFQFAMDPRFGGLAAAEPDGYLYPVYYPDAPSNYARVNDPQLTSLLLAQRSEIDAGKRREIIRQAVRRINEVPLALALNHTAQYELLQPSVSGYSANFGAANGRILTDTWLRK